ncbi:SIS domain-containing protein [Acidianus brierleyi]|uniref:Sugar isomerase n=1 Tax=Acidianus brierleyi TaxID=41673 RepID=A0A2U9IBH7_9CREN|nr:SIS domain-containing protein [Acidianus brierleyi]AWR93376.1 SIS domain-containing protein [Acidianus brierleyi]
MSDKIDYIKIINEELNTQYKIKADINLDSAYVTGAGDSFAASLVIEGKTNGRFRAIDPYDALTYNELDKPLIIVSVSGKPISNIKLAKKFSKKVKIITITANENTELAKLSDLIIKIPYSSKYQLPGTLSFLMSLSALYSIANIEEDKGTDDPFPLCNPFFIGKGENFGIAFYAYLKIAEIFGQKSNYERLEQFCHSPIFSSKNGNVIILSSNDKRERKLYSLIDFTNVYATKCEGAFCNTRTIIRSVLNEMQKKNWNKIYFLEDKKILDVSSKMIYNE